ncbi:hypothetical protein HUG15_11755 [Salicibibacter cibarius]|uniref:Uncharacterized protein n=1 Tax=Salicibibacter cibarius TaxID=2743000 RepID=A0A7T6Z3B6_9BACI|nr:hypothetical protein [Salicibibacter cibarius]QQK76165.1 hypothetical protein HUG15_11755 [Salicibibacter cibarius]
MTAIKFLLGHHQQDNLQYYVRKHSRLLNILTRQINQLEEELMSNSSAETETLNQQSAAEAEDVAPSAEIAKD